LLSVLVFTGAIAGSYPAFYLSGFDPVQTMKKSINTGARYSFNLRQVLVIIQFSFAVILIASTITIYRQLQFIKDRPLGYEVNSLIEIPHEGLLYERYDALKQNLLRSGAVLGVTQSSGSLSSRNSTIRDLKWEGMSEADRLIDFDQIYTTWDFVKTTGIKLISGRDFSKKFASDTAAILLSSKAVKVMGLKNPLGAKVLNQGEVRTVTGVFDDLLWGDRTKAEAPMVIAFGEGISEDITLRLNPAQSLNETIATVRRIVHQHNPDFPVEIRFLDDLNDAKLKNETMLAELSNIFGGLAILISCLGLFGLSAFSIEQRTKEIGIRKVLGASVMELTSLLSLNFLRLVIMAVVIAMPIAFMLMNSWLNEFEIRVKMSWWTYIATACFTLLLALVTVAWQTIRAARAKPVNALKYE
jgi:putative ABC transport system permease protein